MGMGMPLEMEMEMVATNVHINQCLFCCSIDLLFLQDARHRPHDSEKQIGTNKRHYHYHHHHHHHISNRYPPIPLDIETLDSPSIVESSLDSPILHVYSTHTNTHTQAHTHTDISIIIQRIYMNCRTTYPSSVLKGVMT